MNIIMRLLEILIQFTILLMFSYSILTFWGFDKRHFLMIAEGQVPKRTQVHNPSKSNLLTENNTPSNTEAQLKTTEKDPITQTLKSLKSNSSSTSTTTLE